jgi:UDP-N-acetylglucosamine 1-carboxyvinyltransferase
LPLLSVALPPSLGAGGEVGEEAVYVRLKRQNRGQLRGARIDFDYPSVGATETVLMASCFAEGETTISNAACEPEIEELADFMTKMAGSHGLRIEGAGTGKIVVQGIGGGAFRDSSSSSSSLHFLHHSVCPDRIEAGTYLVAGAITESPELVLHNVHHPHVAGITKVLQDMGCCVEERLQSHGRDGDDGLSKNPKQELILAAPSRLRAVDMIRSQPWPGFPTDLLPILHPLLATACGTSTTEETVFDNRMSHAIQLRKFGCDIEIVDNKAVVRGRARGSKSKPPHSGGLEGACVTASDLRGGAALILAGLAAKGETVVDGLHYVDRGYCSLEEKLKNIGADVERIKV